MIDKNLIDYLSSLSSISFSDAEKEEMAKDMTDIIELMDRVKDIDIKREDYPLTFDGEVSSLRDDIIKESLSADELLKNAKGRKWNFIATNKLMGE